MAPRMALRRVRPPLPVRVEMSPTLALESSARMGQLTAFRDAENRFEVAAAYGPWRSSGCWWSGEGPDNEKWNGEKWGDEKWDEEEWDVLARAGNGMGDDTGNDALFACLLVRDRARNAWRLEAFYD